MTFEVVRFTAEDGDSWWSVVLADGGDIATGVMHATREEAEAELRELDEADLNWSASHDLLS
jgi:hypothetical protein